MLDFRSITRKWTSLRRFAGLTVECALESVKQGKVDVASFYSKLLYFLPFSPRSLEKVLSYVLIRASRGYVEKNPSYYTIRVDDVPIDPDEKDDVRTAFGSLINLGIANAAGADAISLRSSIVDDIVRCIAYFITEEIQPMDVEPERTARPYRIVSGISSLYVMHKGNRLPKCYTVLAGLTSPVVKINRGENITVKSTIEAGEWREARNRMSRIKVLRAGFDVEYFKAIGLMIENEVITRTYPMEISGYFIDNVVKPAYQQYYNLLRRRPLGRGP